MFFSGMRTGDESVQSLDPVGEAVFHQEVQSAVGRGRLCPLVQHFEDFIGPKRAVFLQKDFQHAPTRRGQLQTRASTMAVCRSDTGRNAVFVVMGFESDHSGLICYNITFINPLCLIEGESE